MRHFFGDTLLDEVNNEPGVDLLQDLLLRDHHRLSLSLLDPLLLQLLASIPGSNIELSFIPKSSSPKRYERRKRRGMKELKEAQ